MIVTQDKNKNKYKNDLIIIIEGFEKKFDNFFKLSVKCICSGK